MKEVQKQVAEFTDYIGATPESQLLKFKEEAIEALLAHADSGHSETFARELTDVVIVSLGLIHCMGLDFETLFDEKMQIAWNKYRLVPTYIEQGDPPELAQARAKGLWMGQEPMDDGRWDSNGERF